MRRVLTAVSLIAVVALLVGTLVPFAVRENRVVANSQPPRAKSRTTGNRFDRGRLSEQFDSELPHREVADRGIVVSEASGESEADPFAAAPPRRSQPVSIPQRGATFPSDDVDFGTAPPPTPPSSGVPAGRVVLIISADHQIRILAENKSVPPAPPGEGALVVTAEEFALTSPKEPGGGNLLSCTGNVTIRHHNFTAEGSQLSIDKSNLVLVGTAQRPASISKIAKTDPGQEAPVDISDFRLVARKIEFTLSLDKIQVESGTTIVPAAPSTVVPAPAPTPAAPATPPPVNLPPGDPALDRVS